MKLRDYQQQAEDAVFKEWEDGNRSTLLVLPTGLGKTLVFSSVIRRLGKRAMVLAHREELIWQARDKIEKVTGMRADVEMGIYKSSVEPGLFHPKSDVIVSTIQTHNAGGDGAGRMTKFDPMDFDLLVVDEAHHCTSKSYRRVIDYYCTNPNLKVLGVTATPDRADEEALGQVFQSVAFDYEILDAIQNGWLVPIHQQLVSVESLDFSNIHTTAGDLNQGELDAVMMAEKNLHGIASATIDIIGDRRGIGFASSVEHARILSDIFNRHRPGLSNFVHGKTDKDERKQIIADFSAGRVQWLWNCGIFTEGFDDSGVEVISMARPTKSRSLYAQTVGRSTRPHESIAHRLGNMPIAAMRRSAIANSRKPSALIIDFVGNSGKHKLMTSADLLGGKVSDEAIDSVLREARKSGKPMRMDKSLEEEEKRLEEKKKREAEEFARKAKLTAKASYKTRSVNPFDILDVKPANPKGWDKGKVLSEKMMKMLKGAGVNPDGMDYSKAKQLCGLIIGRHASGLCTVKQAGLLKKYGYPTDLKFDQARKVIDAVAANGWRRPAQNPILPTPPKKKVDSGNNQGESNIPF
jgi:superfamily II DNA or RNA helicase